VTLAYCALYKYSYLLTYLLRDLFICLKVNMCVKSKCKKSKCKFTFSIYTMSQKIHATFIFMINSANVD